MPAAPAVEELAAVWTQPRQDVLEIGRGGRGGPERGWIERPAAEREQSQTEQAASDLEATVGDVLVRHPITGEMQRRTQRQCSGREAPVATWRETITIPGRSTSSGLAPLLRDGRIDAEPSGQCETDVSFALQRQA